MLNGKEPKIVNGPEVLNKFVGASEENIRNLFADAEMDYKKMGEASGGWVGGWAGGRVGGRMGAGC